MIIVTGATGQLGRAVVDALLARVPASQIGASVRDPGKAADLTARGVRVREGDFGRPETLGQAFNGGTRLLIVSSNASAYGGNPIAQHRAAIDAARAAGVQRIVYTSHMGASHTSAFPPMLDHARTEGMLGASGVAWTALRNGFYASSGLALMGDALETSVIEAPADGKVSWTAHADLAQAAAIVLTSDKPVDGPTPPLTGVAALDLADMAGIASELLGRPVERRIVADEDHSARMAARGAPSAMADIVLGLYRASRAGEFAAVDPTLKLMLGRAPVELRSLMSERIKG